MKDNIYTPILVILLIGCKNSSVTDIAAEDSFEVNSNHLNTELVFYSDIDDQIQRNYKTLIIENEEYPLTIEKYCLNDSAVQQKIYVDGEANGKLRKALQVYHNYEAKIHLGKQKGDPHTVFLKKIDKQIFKDSLSNQFYNQAILSNVNYHSVRSNRIFFDVILSVPDSDWQEQFMCAIYFRTKKISQLEFWR